MTAWGPGIFEDDIACDWIEDLLDSDPIAFFDVCLDLTDLDSVDYVAGIGVVCSAEMIGASLIGSRPGLPAAALRWLQENGDLEVGRFVPRSIAGLQRVLADDSEMYQRWEDHDEWFDSWLSLRQGLINRLSGYQRVW